MTETTTAGQSLDPYHNNLNQTAKFCDTQQTQGYNFYENETTVESTFDDDGVIIETDRPVTREVQS